MTAVWGGSMANGKWEVGRKSGEAASFLPPLSQEGRQEPMVASI